MRLVGFCHLCDGGKRVLVFISLSSFPSTRPIPMLSHEAADHSDSPAYKGICGLLLSDPNVLPKYRPILSEAPPDSLSVRSISNGGSQGSALNLASAQGLFSV